MKLCYGVFAKVLNLCKPGKRQPTQKELHNRILSSVYEPYRRVGIADDASTRLLQCKQGLQEELIKDARRLIDKGDARKVADHFQKKIIEQHLLKNSEEMRQALVLALLDIIAKDVSISDNTVVDLVGNTTKQELLRKNFFCLPDFLAGIFLYAVVAVDNREGRESCQQIDENYFSNFVKEKICLDLIDGVLPLDFSQKESQQEISPELEAEIIKCNHALSRAQDRIRVYSWDELDFKSIYVLPMLSSKPNPDSQQIYVEEAEIEPKKEKEYLPQIRDVIILNYEKYREELFKRILEEVGIRYLDTNGQDFQDPDMRKERIKTLFECRNIVYVVGGAGYGKSLFLKNLCVAPEILEGFKERPLLVIRGDIKRLIRSDGTFRPMDEYLEECFTNGSLQCSENIDPAFLKKCLEAGRCLVLLDALDEVGNDQRSELHNLIVSYFENTYPENKVCITSRERGFIPRKNITCFYIRAITSDDVKEYVERFIGLNKFDAGEAVKFIDQAEKLIEKGFVKGFLTLSLLMAIYRNEEELPTNKLLLYEKCFEYIATTREKSKRLLRNSSTGEAYDWNILGKFMTDATFMELAHLGTPNNRDISLRSINELMIGLYGRRFDGETECKLATEMFLQFCADRTEVFIPSPNSNLEYKFFHRSFYEYFYAKYIATHTKSADETFSSLLKFDVDSEIFELIVTLYERSNPNYLREFISYVLQYAEKVSLQGGQESHSFDVFVMVMQPVEDKDFLHRFIELFLKEGDVISQMDLAVDFGMIGTVLMRDQNFFIKKVKENDEFMKKKVENELIRFILTKNKECADILKNVKKKTVSGECSVENIRMVKGFTYTKLSGLCTEPYEMMEYCLKKFTDRKYLIMQRKLSVREIEKALTFSEEVKQLALKDRNYVYNEIMQRM